MNKRGLSTCIWGLLMTLGACSAEPSGAEKLGDVSESVVEACATDSDCVPEVTGKVCSPINGCVSPASCYTAAAGPGVVVGDVVVDEVDTEGDLSVLADAWCVTGNLTIENTALWDFEAMHDLVAVGDTLTINDNANVYWLSGFDNLRQALKLTMMRNAQLVTLSGAPQLKTLSTLQLYANPQLRDMWGLDGLTRISGAEIVNNASLSSLWGLQNLASVYGYLDIRQNPLLTNLGGLSSLTTVGNLVQVMDNPGLLSLDGMPSLREIGSTLRVQRNPVLETVGGLNVVTSVGTFQVSDNPRLDSCELAELATQVSADCSGCVQNGPCRPQLSFSVQGVDDDSKYNEFPYGSVQPGDTLSIDVEVFNQSPNDVVLSPARITVDDAAVSAVGSAPFVGVPANTVPAGGQRFASPWLRLANDAPSGHVVSARIDVDWTLGAQSGTLTQTQDIAVASASSAYGSVYLAFRQLSDNLPENGAGALDGRFVPGERLVSLLAVQNRERSPVTVHGLRLVTDNPAFIDLVPHVEEGAVVAEADTLFIEPTFAIASNAAPSNALVHYELDYEQNGQQLTARSPYFWPQVTVP